MNKMDDIIKNTTGMYFLFSMSNKFSMLNPATKKYMDVLKKDSNVD